MLRTLLTAAALAVPLASAAPAAATPQPYEPIVLKRLALPEGVSSMSFPAYLPDSRHLVFGFTSAAFPNGQLGVIADDGSGFACLTCGMEQVVRPDRPFNANRPLNVGKPFVFPDGKRVLVREPGREDLKDSTVPGLPSGPTADFNYFIFECAPSLVDCKQRALVPLELPGGGLTRLTQNREGRISPDGRRFAWTEVQTDGTKMSMGKLVRGDGVYTVDGVMVLNPQFTLGEKSGDFRLAAPLYELKAFDPDGKSVSYASFTDAENYDSYELDLRTGERRRLSTDIEWNEDSSLGPGGGWFINGSSRTRERMAPFSLLPRPPFVDFPVYVLIGRFQLADQNRTCLLEPWLVPRSGEEGSYFGQPVYFGGKKAWGSHGPSRWAPDGTKFVFWERTAKAERTPQDPDARVIVARLPARRAVPAEADTTTPTPMWATSRDQWDGFADTQGTFTVKGDDVGTATLSYPVQVN